MRDRLIELICENIQTDECVAHCNHPYCDKCKNLADYLLANGVIVPPCNVGDTVYITRIDGLNEDDSPIFKIEQGKVYKIEVDNTRDTIWIGANFGILHCCRPYTDYCYSREEAEAKLKGEQ